jgi:hypothetical protein
MVERTKNALEFLKGAPFLAAALAVEGGIEAANRGKKRLEKELTLLKQELIELRSLAELKKSKQVIF